MGQKGVIMGGRSVGWQVVEATADGFVDLNATCGQATDALAWAVTRLHAPRALKVKLALGSDDGILVELNGREVFRNDCARGAARGQDKVTLALRRGDNLLRLKISQFTMGWGFYAALEGPAAKAVKSRRP